MHTETAKSFPRTAKRNGRRPGRKWWTLGVIALLVAGGGYRMATRKKPDDTRYVTAERRDIRQTVSATGAMTLETTAEVKIGAEVSGRVKRLLVNLGDRVTAGQLLVEMENPESDALLAQTQASVDASKARVSSSETALAQQGPQSDADVQRARSELKAVEARLRQALINAETQPASTEAAIRQASAALKVAQDALSQARESAAQNVQAAQAALDSALAQAEKAGADADRARKVYAKGFISQAALDAAISAQRVADAGVVSARQSLSLAEVNSRHAIASATSGVEQAEAALEAAKTGRSQVALRAAELDAARQSVAQARQALRSAVAGLRQNDLRREAVREARAGLRQASAEYQRQQRNREKMMIFAPISGTVTTLDVKQGETITAGFQTPTLMTVTNLDRMQVEVPVDETDIGRVRVGQTAKVTVDAYQNDPLPGHVVRVASSPTLQQNVVTYNVTIALDRPRAGLRPKMTATVAIDTGLVRNVVAVPLDAVKQSKDSDVVYFAPDPKAKPQDRSKFVRKDVKTGVSDDKFIEIRSGLKPGDRIVLSSGRLDAQRRMENL